MADGESGVPSVGMGEVYEEVSVRDPGGSGLRGKRGASTHQQAALHLLEILRRAPQHQHVAFPQARVRVRIAAR